MAAEPNPKPIDRDGVVQTAEGRDVQLGDVLSRGATIVIFLSRFSAPSLQLLTDLPVFYRESQRLVIDVVVVTAEPPSPGLQSFLIEYELSVPVLHDSQRKAINTFRVHGTPHVVVTDHRARIRYEPASLADALRYAHAVDSKAQVAGRTSTIQPSR